MFANRYSQGVRSAAATWSPTPLQAPLAVKPKIDGRALGAMPGQAAYPGAEAYGTSPSGHTGSFATVPARRTPWAPNENNSCT